MDTEMFGKRNKILINNMIPTNFGNARWLSQTSCLLS